MEKTLQINVFKDGGLELFKALLDEEIPVLEKRSDQGAVMASAHFIEVVTLLGGASLVPSIAAVLVQWLKNQASRKIVIQTKRGTIIHAEGLGVEQLTEAIEQAESISAMQTESDDVAS